jgi:hypothetical protein
MIPMEVDMVCATTLGTSVASELFERGHLSRVYGLVLDDGRRVVAKVRPWTAGIQTGFQVQERLAAAGFPCPAPLGGAPTIGDDDEAISFEELVEHDPTAGMPARGRARRRAITDGAALLARMVKLAPAPDALTVRAARSPAPPWAAWDHDQPGTWPVPDEPVGDLNAMAGPDWIEDAGRRARSRLREASLPDILGHLDWEAQNMAWADDRPVTVFDWDSVGARPEAAVAGLAAAVFPAGSVAAGSAAATVAGASLDETEAFLAAYEAARGAPFPAAEREVAWAAGLWVLAFNARKEATGAPAGPRQDVLAAGVSDRLRRAGA